MACSEPRLKRYGIACADHPRQRVYRFPPGKFALSQQVWLPARVAVEGAASPNVPGEPRRRQDLAHQTLFVATGKGCGGNTHPRTKTAWPIPRVWGGGGVPIKCVRKGFLMSDETSVRDINGQGIGEEGAGMGAGLNGGAFFELPGCITTFAFGGRCGRGGEHGEGGDHGPNFVTGSGRGVSNVMIENVRLNDVLDGSASFGGFWSAMTPDDSAHRNITFRKVVAMKTERDGVNVHGHVVGWTGEDLHFENQGDDVFAVWGAGGGDVPFTGLGGDEDVKCGLSNRPPTDVVFRRAFAGAGSSVWSSCAHIFGSGSVVYDNVTCCSNVNEEHPTWVHALIIDSTFCPDYKTAGVTVKDLRWYDTDAKSLCTPEMGPVYAAAGPDTHWKEGDLDIQQIGCGSEET